jgi:hypothetical protein
MVTTKKANKVRGQLDYVRSARLVARWGRCAKIGALVYRSDFSDAECDIFYTQLLEHFNKKETW